MIQKSFLEFFENQATKNDEFLKKLTIGNLVCIKTCYSFKPAKPFQWAKKQVPKIVIFWNHPDWCLEACWPKLPISRKHFWTIILSLDKNDKPRTKGQPFKKSSHKERCFKLEVHLWYASLLGIDRPWEGKKRGKKKNDCHVMHLKNSI